MKSYKIVLTVFAGIILLAQGCKETPTSVGFGVLPPGDTPGITVDTLRASSYSTVSTQISTFGSDRLLVGKYSGYNALTTLQFAGIPAGFLDTVAITDAHIELHAIYHFGDPPGAFDFTGFALTASSDSANYDSLTTMSGNYYSSNPILTYPTSDTGSILCPIDTAVVRSWFSASASTANYGVILVATKVSTIKGFASFANSTSSYVPRLVVNYTKNGTTGSVTDSTGVSRFLANIPQPTLVLSDPQSMFVQCGVAYRAQLNFGQFSLPKAGLILKADLELTYNSASSNLNSFAADTLFSYFVNKDSTIATLPVPGQTITAGGNKIYRFAIADYVRSWANGDTLRRLQFGGLRETSSLDLFALFGTLSPIAVRPRLIVTHIVQ